MIKYIAHVSTGYCGSDAYVAFSMDPYADKKEIHNEVYQIALENAEMYGYYPLTEDVFDDYAEGEVPECYVESIEGSYELYNPEKHDQHRAGGGSFAKDF